MLLPRIFYWVFGSVSFILLTATAGIFYYGQKAQDQYTKVEGAVIKNQYKGDMARPVIRYSWDGKELLYVDNTYTNPPAYERDEKVELFVNPGDPEDVWINTFMGRYFVMTILGGLGLLFLGFLILFHFAFNKH
jgi:hypothetical protein